MFKKFFTQKRIIALVIIILLFSLYFLGFLRPVESGLQRLVNYSSHQLASLRFSENYYQSQELKEIIESLEKNLAEKNIQEAKIEILKEENKQLREYLDFYSDKEYEIILANISSREIRPGKRTNENNLIIDKGKKDGLSVGLVVSNEKGYVVGKIIEVKENTSLVCLLTSTNCQLAATILNQERSLGLTDGQLGLTISLNMIPQTETIEIGDIVVTSGLSETIPKGLVIGQVSSLEKKSNEIWQNAIIEAQISLTNLNILSVIIP